MATISPGTLYVVATPIGNREDLSHRAERVIGTVAAVYAEDTRSLHRLGVGVHGPVRSLFDANEAARTEEVLARLQRGEDVALVSEAGTPAVSDPGFRIVRAAIEAGLPVAAVPGPSAVVAALVVSGLPTDAFRFGGFLPRASPERRRAFREVTGERATLVYFESPHRVAACLEDARAVLGDRRVAVARELTKVHETVYRGRLSEVQAALPEEVKGEVTLVIEGAPEGAAELTTEAVGEAVAAQLAQGASVRDAADAVSARLGAPRKEVYRMALALARRRK